MDLSKSDRTTVTALYMGMIFATFILFAAGGVTAALFDTYSVGFVVVGVLLVVVCTWLVNTMGEE